MSMKVHLLFGIYGNKKIPFLEIVLDVFILSYIALATWKYVYFRSDVYSLPCT